MLNDTGSTISSMFDTDVLALDPTHQYTGYGLPTELSLADGSTIDRPVIFLQAVIMPIGPGVMRLSGKYMRREFFFASPKGNMFTAVSTAKTALVNLLG